MVHFVSISPLLPPSPSTSLNCKPLLKHLRNSNWFGTLVVRQGITFVGSLLKATECACVCLLARVLLVDYSPPFDADTCEYLHDALVNFFSLVTHLSGPCRTPFFGLFALIDHPEVGL